MDLLSAKIICWANNLYLLVLCSTFPVCIFGGSDSSVEELKRISLTSLSSL